MASESALDARDYQLHNNKSMRIQQAWNAALEKSTAENARKHLRQYQQLSPRKAVYERRQGPK